MRPMFLPSVQPLERQGTAQVSGSSDGGSGPSDRSRCRMSSRHASLASIQRCSPTSQSFSSWAPGHASISAR